MTKKEKSGFGWRVLLQTLRHPFLFGFLVATIVYLSFVIYYWSDLATGYPEDNLFFASIMFYFIIWLGLGITGMILQEKYITYIDSESWDNVLILLRISEGKVIETSKTVLWGKENKETFKIFLPERDWQIGEKIALIGTILSKHGAIETKIPYNLMVSTNGNFDWQEVYEKLILESKEPNLKTFVRKRFEFSIAEIQEALDKLCRDHAEGKISKQQLLERIIEAVEFPIETLKGFKDFTIRLGEPTSQACKGVCRT